MSSVSDQSLSGSGHSLGGDPFQQGPSLDTPQTGAPVVRHAAGTATVSGTFARSTIEKADSTDQPPPNSTANLDPSNPRPAVPNQATAQLNGEETAKSGKNAFLSGIYAVVLEIMTAAIVKLGQMQQKADSQQYLHQKKEQKEITDDTAASQERAGKIEMWGCFASALACGVSTLTHLGMAGGSAAFGGRSAAGMATQSLGNAVMEIGGKDGIGDKLGAGFKATLSANESALQTNLQYAGKLAQESADRADQDRKESADAVQAALQSYMKATDAQFAFIQKG